MKLMRKRAFLLCLVAGLVVGGHAQAKRKEGAGNGPGDGDGGTVAQPLLSFSADRSEYSPGDRVQLSWASVETKFCTASGDWEGKFGVDGVFRTPPLDGPKTYHLKCASKGGGVMSSVSVALVAAEPEQAPEPVPAPDPQPAPEPESATVPTIAFIAQDTQLAQGGSTVLSWTSTAADGCVAGGDWTGTFGPTGSQTTGAIDASSDFSLTCSGAGGSVSASVLVVVVAPPAISFAAADTQVNAGGSTTLNWAVTDAESCQASGGWSGVRSSSGSELVGPIGASTTFTLSCGGIGGNAMRIVSISAVGEVSINWVAPSENVDGTPLTDLASYRIYYGTESRSYSNGVDVVDPSVTNHAFRAPSGDYFVTMTALDVDGNESAYANEVLLSVP